MTKPELTEFKVDMVDRNGKPSFALVNAQSAVKAARRTEELHRDKTIIRARPTGRKF